MAEEKYIKIGGRLHSIATDNVSLGANEVFDDDKNKKQSDINAETDAALEDRYTKAETYSKTQLDSMITTPKIAYKNYDTYADMIAETNHPAGAIYRVANYDGTQAVTNKYAEYSWDSTQYKLMAVRDYGIDDKPTAGSENLVKSGGVPEALSLNTNDVLIKWKYGYVSTTGIWHPGSYEDGYIGTPDYYYVRKNTKLILNLFTVSNRAGIAFYNSKSEESVVSAVNITAVGTEWVAPSDGYVRFSNRLASVAEPSIEVIAPAITGIKENISEINGQISGLSTLMKQRNLGSVISKGYLNIDNTNNKIIVSQTIYFVIKGQLKSLAAGTYDNNYSDSNNYVFVVIDSSSTPTIKMVNSNATISEDEVVVAALTRNEISWDNVVASSIEVRIDGVSTNKDVTKIKNTSRFGCVSSKGYVNIDNVNSKIELSAAIYFTFDNQSRSINAGTYDNTYSETDNYVYLVLDCSTNTTTIKLVRESQVNYDTQLIIASITRSTTTWNRVCSSILEVKIDGVSINTRVDDVETRLTTAETNIDKLKKHENFSVLISRGYINIDTVNNKFVVSSVIEFRYNGTKKSISAGTYDNTYSGTNNFLYLVIDCTNTTPVIKFIASTSALTDSHLVIATVTRSSSAPVKINHVVCSSIELRIDGVSSETKINSNTARIDTLEEKIALLDRNEKAVEYTTVNLIREENLRKQFAEGSEPAHWYGIDWVEEENADNVTAIYSEGDSELHTTLPIQNKMRRCIVKDGRVVYYLDANNSELKEDGITPSVLDGTDGNVMVEIPNFFYKYEQETVNGVIHHKIKISEQGLPDFKYMPRRLTSAYECTFNRSTNKLVSVCTTKFTRATEEVMTVSSSSYVNGNSYSRGTHKTAKRNGYSTNAALYRGGNNDATLDTYTSPSDVNFERNNLGIPCGDFISDDLMSNVNIDNREVPYLYDTFRALWMLCLIEYKNRNIQETALGVGATNCLYEPYIQFFGQDNHSLSCLPCGITNSLGNNSGFVYYKQQNVPTSYSGGVLGDYSDYWIPCMSYRGVEHFYGHLYDVMPQVRVDQARVNDSEQPSGLPTGKRVYDVTYHYCSNPFYIGVKTPINLGTYRFCCDIMPYNRLLLGDDVHLLPIDAANYGLYDKYYTNCVEYSGGSVNNKVLRVNGRTVSGTLCGIGFFSTYFGNVVENSQCARLDILV